MRLGFGVALLVAAILPFHAQADNLISVSVDAGSPFVADFTLDLTTNPAPASGIYTFTDPNATLNGSSEPLTINVGQGLSGQSSLELVGSGLDESFLVLPSLGIPIPFFDPGPPPTVNPGTYLAFDTTACGTAKVQYPMAGLPATLAMFQTPVLDCFTTANVVASSVTPEPSTVALLATGLVGVAGVVRRRYHP